MFPNNSNIEEDLKIIPLMERDLKEFLIKIINLREFMLMGGKNKDT